MSISAHLVCGPVSLSLGKPLRRPDGRLRPGHPRSNPSGIVRRREGTAVDEAFTRSLRWEPTEYLRRHALGLDDTDHVQITEAEAVDFALGVIAARLRPRVPPAQPPAGA
jgi:hypothetical protein